MPRPRSHPGSPKVESKSRVGREVWELLLQLYESEKPTIALRCQEYGLTPQQAYLLKHLEPGRPMAMNELASILSCDASNITGLIDRLEARGFVKRQQSRHDRRLKMIVVTARGARHHQQLLERLLEPPPSLLGPLTPMQLRLLRDLLMRAVGGVERRARPAA